MLLRILKLVALVDRTGLRTSTMDAMDGSMSDYGLTLLVLLRSYNLPCTVVLA
jgi:hypothetical protein